MTLTITAAHAGELWSKDRDDGTYTNPILNADWSDLDAIRVGDDYYMIASSIHRVPGLPVLHSRDLVNWDLITHALPRLLPEADFLVPRHGCGVWAPAIRHHDGRFWIAFPDPDRGLFMISATDPAGPWTEPHLLKAGRGLIDPCPFWDEDGNAYLVHAWARSRAGINNKITLHRMSPDGTALLDDGVVIIDGDGLPGYRTLEGPKFYRRDGWYWVFAPAGGVAEGWQSVFRSRSPYGPYEHRIVLTQGPSPVNGPHQGAWVTTPSGEEWFLHFQDRGAFGRVVHLQPMRWTVDGWPEMGAPDAPGVPVSTYHKPIAGSMGHKTHPPLDDDFEGSSPGLQWTWAANPSPDWWSMEPGGLRLWCVPAAERDPRQLPQLLGMRLPGDAFRLTTSIRLADSRPDNCAGLAVVGRSHAWIGLERTDDGLRLVSRGAVHGEPERSLIEERELPDDVVVHLTLEGDTDARCRFTATFAEGAPVVTEFEAEGGVWVGATIGLFATGVGGYATFGPVHVAPTRGGRP